jgi:hypothetical protein
MVLKLPAILPSGSAGKFLKKIWNLEKKGGEEAILLPYYDPPFKCRVPNRSTNPDKPIHTKCYSDQQKVNKPPTKFWKYNDKKVVEYIYIKLYNVFMNIKGVL